MKEVFKILYKILGDIADKRYLKIGKELEVIIYSIVLVILIDMTFNFSYNYHLNQKIKQVELISKLNKNKKLSVSIRNEILTIESEIIDKKHYSERLENLLKWIKSIEFTKPTKRVIDLHFHIMIIILFDFMDSR